MSVRVEVTGCQEIGRFGNQQEPPLWKKGLSDQSATATAKLGLRRIRKQGVDVAAKEGGEISGAVVVPDDQIGSAIFVEVARYQTRRLHVGRRPDRERPRLAFGLEANLERPRIVELEGPPGAARSERDRRPRQKGDRQ